MAKLSKEKKASVMIGGEEAVFTFRDPTNKELNDFLASRYPAGRRGRSVKDNTLHARCVFFDLLIKDIKDLEDAEGLAVTPERLDVIPSNYKNDVIFSLFEDNEVDVKN